MRKFLFPLVVVILVLLSFTKFSYSQAPTVSSTTYRGDLNEDGQVNIFDLLDIFKMLADPSVKTEREREIADVNESGGVDIFDILGILKLLSGEETPGIIVWEPMITGMGSASAGVGDTFAVYLENIDESVSVADVKARINGQDIDILDFSQDSVRVIIPEWFNGGEFRLIAATDTTNAMYIQSVTFVSIPAGSFQMGSTTVSYGEPVHTVTLSAYQMSTKEITNAQYAAYLNAALDAGEITATTIRATGAKGDYSGQEFIYLIGSWSYYPGNDCWISYDGSSFSVESGKENRPVSWVSWYGSKAFALHYGWDLPTEAQWEYAARGGRGYEYGTDDGTISSKKANYGMNVGYPVDVGSYPPNPFGLYDMCGNLHEWCSDWLGDYSSESQTDPAGPVTGQHRVLRGGYWLLRSLHCGAANRDHDPPDYRLYYMGFRVVHAAISQELQ